MNRNVCSWMIAAGLVTQIAYGEDAAKKDAAPAAVTAPAVAASTNAPAGPPPKIQFDKTVYDFGATSMVTQLAGKFIISNTGSGTLQIQKPRPSCGCTVPDLKKATLAPGESTELAFTVNVGMPRGNLSKTISVPSNDPTQPSVTLSLKAEIVPTFDATPQSISLGNIHQGAITNLTVEIKRLDGKPLGLTKAEATRKNVRPKLVLPEGTNNMAKVQIEIEAEGLPQPFNDSIRVFAGDATQPAVTIPVNGRVVGDVTATPETQFWGIADPDNWPGAHPEATVKKFTIACTKPGAKLEIKKATSDLADVSVDYKSVEEGKSYEVTATLAKAPKQSEKGTIKLETNLPGQPVVELGLTINVLNRTAAATPQVQPTLAK